MRSKRKVGGRKQEAEKSGMETGAAARTLCSFLPERQLTVSGGATPTRKKEGQVTDCHFAGNKDTCSRYFLTYSLSHQSSGQHMDHFSEGDLGSFFQKDKNSNDNTNII